VIHCCPIQHKTLSKAVFSQLAPASRSKWYYSGMSDPTAVDSYGDLLKYWRKRSGVSQIDLALECDTSSRHLSCVETERAHPSRHLLLRLCTTLDIPLRARNSILISAGYAPLYEKTGLSEPEMAEARQVLAHILRTNEPKKDVQVFPAGSANAAGR
jgi:transcriptional regulator with XRE-family HTH domain